MNGAARPAPRAAVAPGDRIDGRYDIEALLGTGGMAVVYRARHAGTRGVCALKLVHPHLVSRRDLIDLFLKEARATGRIGRCDHVVAVLDAGFDPDRGVPYLALELLEGETLDQWCARHGPMPPALVGAIFEQLAEAIEQAHGAGVIHRDLKPANLFLTAGARGRPHLKVMDFGIAKVLEAGAHGTATQIGTPAYAAPEQMGAALREVAARQGITVAVGVSIATDVWPLGLIAYELLTGLPAGQFWGAEATAEIPVKAVLLPRELPSARAGDRAGRLPAGFDAWFARATRTDAAARFSSVREACAALGAILDPPAAPPDPPAARVRRRWIAPAAAVIAAAILAAATAAALRVRAAAARDACRSSGARCEEACEDGDGAACARVGPIAPGRADVFQRGCDHGAARGCAVLAAAYREGSSGIGRDLPRAAALFQRACDGGDLAGCDDLGGLLQLGRGVPRDDRAAAALYLRACDGGELRGCSDLGVLVGAGRGGYDRDDRAAAALFERACGGGALLGCANLGVFHEQGRGGLDRDDARAAALYRRACDGGEPHGCGGLGALHEQGRGGLPLDIARARSLYTEACDAGDAPSCRRLGGLYEQGTGGLARDEARAQALFRRACEGGDARGCDRIGERGP